MANNSIKTILLRIHHRLLPENENLSWTPYPWLVYLIGFTVPGLHVSNGVYAPAVMLATVVFLVLYFRAHWKKGREIWPYIAGMTVIGLATLPIIYSALTFFVYASSFTRMLPSQKQAWTGIAVVMLVMTVGMLLFSYPAMIIAVAAVFTVLIGAINVHHAQVERGNAALKLSQEEVRQLAAVAERERIARDLHDLLGHTLSVISIKAELAHKMVDRDPKRAQAETKEIQRISREALREVRETVSGYRQLGLAGELANARLALETMDIQIRYTTPDLTMDGAQEAALAMVLRESITNILRHARATRVTVDFAQDGEHLHMTVGDNGVGGSKEAGGGITGMRKRMNELGGALTIEVGEGRRVSVSLPRADGVGAPETVGGSVERAEMMETGGGCP